MLLQTQDLKIEMNKIITITKRNLFLYRHEPINNCIPAIEDVKEYLLSLSKDDCLSVSLSFWWSLPNSSKTTVSTITMAHLYVTNKRKGLCEEWLGRSAVVKTDSGIQPLSLEKLANSINHYKSSEAARFISNNKKICWFHD